MYNAEKYIGTLLESILVQTFTDFEVIIVDDCSTDSSCAVVESYLENFGGRLRLVKLEKNSSGPGTPTNKGIAHTRGKYIWALDNDDLITKNAVEVLYDTAEKFNADVIYMDSYFDFKDDTQNFIDPKNFKLHQGITGEPVFYTNDIGERIKLFCRGRISVVGWLKFVRKDFLVENEIFFQEDVKASQDITWTIELICYAKRFLKISEPLYIYRRRADSVSHKTRPDMESIEYRGHLFINGTKFLLKFFAAHEFFQKNLQYSWMLLTWLNRRYSKNFVNALSKLQNHDVQKALENLFAVDFVNNSDLIAYLCTLVYTLRLKEKNYLEKIKKLESRVVELENKVNELSQN